MINRLLSVTLAIFLIGGFGALALAASGSPSNGSNAAVTQYVTPEPIPGGSTPPIPGGHGVKGAQETGGKTHSGGGGPESGTAGKTAHGGSGPVETAATGPASAASGLPFTGYDAWILAGVGLLLVLAGVAQRRFDTKRHS